MTFFVDESNPLMSARIGVFYKRPLSVLLLGSVLALGGYSAQANDLGSLFGQASSQKFLPVHQAFKVSATQSGNDITVSFGITPEHYVYRDKLKLTLPSGVSASAWQFSRAATSEEDPVFGKVAVFDQNVTAKTTLSAVNPVTGELSILWQGCARAGLCYPPETVTVKVDLMGNTSTQQAQAAKSDTKSDTKTNVKVDADKATDKSTDKETGNQAGAQTATVQDNQSPLVTKITQGDSEQGQGDDAHTDTDLSPMNANVTNFDSHQAPSGSNLAQLPIINPDLSHQSAHSGELNDPFGLSKNPLLSIGLLFLAGIVLAFSACVYPMIPIVTNIVAHQHNPTTFKAFLLTLAYGLGVATSYGILGMLVAFFGRSLGIIGWMQNPWVLISFAVIFVLLALHMLEVVRFGLPAGVRDRLARAPGRADRWLGSLFGSFVVGLASALVVSPCVSAPLGGALVAIAASGQVVLGFFALFALGFGLSLPLVIMGTAQGRLMPKSGEWMHGVRTFGGFLLFGMAILLLNRVYFGSAMLVLWAVWLLAFALWLWRWQKLLLQALAGAMVLWSALLLVGASVGSQDPWQPLSVITETIKRKDTAAKSDHRVTDLESLDVVLMRHPLVLVDVTADWCIECRIMDKTLFADPPAELDDFVVVKLDVSDTTGESRAALARYGLFGPPALLYYKNGKLMVQQIGEIKRDDFVLTLVQVANQK